MLASQMVGSKRRTSRDDKYENGDAEHRDEKFAPEGCRRTRDGIVRNVSSDLDNTSNNNIYCRVFVSTGILNPDLSLLPKRYSVNVHCLYW